MNKLSKVLLTSMTIAVFSGFAYAAELTPPQKTLNLRAETNKINNEVVAKDNFIKSKLTSAENKFMQGNIKASHDDFEDIIAKTSHDDYVFLTYGIKMAGYGFFDLTEELFSKLDNNLYTQNYIKDIKKYYYPSCIISEKDIYAMADAYAGIIYNNLAIETTSELLNNSEVQESDYKNYLIALGYYKSGDLQHANKYIVKATAQNGSNVNYKMLQAKILSDLSKHKQAKKVLTQIKKSDFITVDFQDRVKAAEEYVLYKIAKNETLKDYHLAYYYHLLDKSYLAAKVLQASVLQAKKYSSDIYSLLGKVYYDNDEHQKAEEYANSGYKEDSKNYLAVITMADLSFDNGNYEEALKYYKEAQKLTKDSAPSVGIAKTYLALKQNKKSVKLYEKLLKKHKLNENLLADSLRVFPQRADYYLPAIASVDITNNEMWLGLANLAIQDGNYNMAQTYLNNSYYIDENNFKYYYYLSRLLMARGETEKANLSLIKCARLNSDYEAFVYEK